VNLRGLSPAPSPKMVTYTSNEAYAMSSNPVYNDFLGKFQLCASARLTFNLSDDEREAVKNAIELQTGYWVARATVALNRQIDRFLA
jgi:hypothetical protein